MQQSELEELIAEGLSGRAIAERLGCSQSNVRHWMGKYGLRTRRGPLGQTPLDGLPKRCSCGETDPDKFYPRARYQCRACKLEYTLKRQQANRQRAVAHLGGACVRCGFDKFSCALDIHHPDPSVKDAAFASMRGWSWERTLKEIKDCILLCKNCHAIDHHLQQAPVAHLD